MSERIIDIDHQVHILSDVFGVSVDSSNKKILIDEDFKEELKEFDRQKWKDFCVSRYSFREELQIVEYFASERNVMVSEESFKNFLYACCTEYKTADNDGKEVINNLIGRIFWGRYNALMYCKLSDEQKLDVHAKESLVGYAIVSVINRFLNRKFQVENVRNYLMEVFRHLKYRELIDVSKIVELIRFGERAEPCDLKREEEKISLDTDNGFGAEQARDGISDLVSSGEEPQDPQCSQDVVLDSKLYEKLLMELTEGAISRVLGTLSESDRKIEKEVIELWRDGCSAEEIAEQLGIDQKNAYPPYQRLERAMIAIINEYPEHYEPLRELWGANIRLKNVQSYKAQDVFVPQEEPIWNTNVENLKNKQDEHKKEREGYDEYEKTQ